MKKVFLFIFFSFFTRADCVIDDVYWNDTLWPDLRLVLQPMMFNDFCGASAFFEAGRQNYRLNGTIGGEFESGVRGKFSAEYLNQKLGFAFCKSRKHHRVNQAAVGASLQLPVNLYNERYITEWGVSYSHSDKKSLRSEIVPRANEICLKNIAGSNGYRLFCGSYFSPWYSGVFIGNLVYNYIKFDRSYQKDKAVSGLGLNFGFDQVFFQYSKIHLGVSIEAPFIAYDASIFTQFYLFNCPIRAGLYGQRVHGLKSIPSSSRIGIEIDLDLQKICMGGCKTNSTGSLAEWLSEPAVYVPEVLVMKDQKIEGFGSAPSGNLPAEITVRSGTFSFDLSDYFSGTSPLIYGASPLPPGLTLNPVSGKITGVISGSFSASYPVIVKVTNYFGTFSQPVTFNY